MNEYKILIIVKGEDRTKEVEHYQKQGTSLKIKYKNNEKEYPYSIKNVTIIEQAEILDITNQEVYYKNNHLLNVRAVIQFNDLIKVIYQSNLTEIFEYKDISFQPISNKDSNITNVLAYFKEISKYTTSKEEEQIENDSKEPFLEREYNKLNYISQESVLYYYLNQKDLTPKTEIVNDIIYPFGFNISQKEAVENVYKSNISIIEGPPGTGKTQTILNIIANLAIMQNKTVAVVSNNNEAVQNVKDKLKKYGYEYICAHLGRKKYRESFFENLPQPHTDHFNVTEDLTTLLQEINILNRMLDELLIKDRRKAELKNQLSAYQLEQQYFNLYYEEQNLEKIEELSFYHKTADRILDFLLDCQLLSNDKIKFPFLQKMKILLKYGTVNLKSLDNHLIEHILYLQKQYYELKIASLKEEYQAVEDELKRYHFEEIQKKHQQVSNMILKKVLFEKYNQKNNQFEEESYKNNMTEFIDSFPIILSTTYSLRNSIPKDFMFDYVIIDESSQVDLLAGSLALSCAKNAVIVGDTKQLPQIVDKKIKKQIGNFQIDSCHDYFQNNILSAFLMMYEQIPKKVLREHYRCHPKIIEFCNKRYYHGELIPFASEEHLKIETPLVLSPTPPGNFMHKVTNGEKNGTYNFRELEVIKESVLSNKLFDGYQNSEVGITTPYRFQANLITEELEKIIECDTIHKFQGKEKELMILSTVLDSSYLGKMGIKFVDDPCMINVAVSRAINQFVVVTDNKLFHNHGHEIKALLKYIKYNTLHSEIIESDLVSVFDLLYKEHSKKLDSLSKRLLNRYKFKSENIMDTILYEEFASDDYKDYQYYGQEFLRTILTNIEHLTKEEQQYINNGASVDFVVHDKMDGKPVLFIEVDGFHYHKNNITQLKKDKLKDSIAKKCKIKMLRFPTGDRRFEEKQVREIIRNTLLKT